MREKVYYSKEVKHYEGLNLRNGANIRLKLTNYYLKICDINNRDILNISLKDIVNVAIISDKELIEKDKSVIGRGLVGGVLFGGVGLLLGGLSGVGSKSVMQNVDYLVINYKDNDEDKVINLYANSGILDSGFMKGLNYAIDSSKKELKCPKCGKVYNFGELKCANCGKILSDVKGAKIVGGIIGGILLFLIIIIAIAMSVGGGNSKEVNIIKRVANVETEKAKSINNILEEVGIDDFDNMVADSDGLDGFEGVDSKGYRIKTAFSDNVILYLDSDNNVICIRYADKDYYRDGKAINKFD